MNKKLFASIAAGISFSSLCMTTAFASTSTIHVNHNVDLRSAPYLRSHAIVLEKSGATLTLESGANRYWWYVKDQNGRTGYVTKNRYYTAETKSPSNTTGSIAMTKQTVPLIPTTSAKTLPRSQEVIHVVEGDGVPATINLANDTPQQQKLIQTALTQLGVSYWWGHQVPNYAPVNGRDGFDCSNFVAWAYKTAVGIDFSGSSVYQRFHVGTPVSLNSLQAGDLLFFANASEPNGQGHVGMYIGGGLIIQEGGGRGKATVESLNNRRAWFGRSLVFARRVL